MKHPEYEKLNIPRIKPEIKEMNGKSSRRLRQCIDQLTELLENEDSENCSRPADDSSSE